MRTYSASRSRNHKLANDLSMFQIQIKGKKLAKFRNEGLELIGFEGGFWTQNCEWGVLSEERGGGVEGRRTVHQAEPKVLDKDN